MIYKLLGYGIIGAACSGILIMVAASNSGDSKLVMYFLEHPEALKTYMIMGAAAGAALGIIKSNDR